MFKEINIPKIDLIETMLFELNKNGRFDVELDSQNIEDLFKKALNDGFSANQALKVTAYSVSATIASKNLEIVSNLLVLFPFAAELNSKIIFENSQANNELLVLKNETTVVPQNGVSRIALAAIKPEALIQKLLSKPNQRLWTYIEKEALKTGDKLEDLCLNITTDDKLRIVAASTKI